MNMLFPILLCLSTLIGTPPSRIQETAPPRPIHNIYVPPTPQIPTIQYLPIQPRQYHPYNSQFNYWVIIR